MHPIDGRSNRPSRASRHLPVLGDVVVAALYTAVLVAQVLLRPTGTIAGAGVTAPAESIAAPVFALLVAAGIGLPIAFRRRRPVLAMAVSLAMSLVAALFGILWDPLLGAALALYTVAAADRGGPQRRSRVPAWLIGVLSTALALGLVMAGTPQSASGGVGDAASPPAIGVVIMGFAWALGRGERERRQSAERIGRQLAAHAVTQERLRIAREMHDVVAHSMGIITVQAGVANHVAESRPQEARDALRVIESTGRDALTELRRMLDVLRSPADGRNAAEAGSDTGSGSSGGGDGRGEGEDAPELAPAPGIAALPALTERAAQAGVRVDLTVDVAERLPDGLELAVFRIVQEALTNIVKHAAPARAVVDVSARDGAVHVEVTDDGPGERVLPSAPDQGPGHGLIGMAERVGVYRGRFAAGPRDDGGFRVSATLPYGEPEPERLSATAAIAACAAAHRREAY